MRLIRLLKNDLAKEVTTWVKKDLITPVQARNICHEYGIDYNNPSRHSYGYYILATLGYLFMGLACITLIGANWESIPRAVRMICLITATLGVQTAGIYQYRQDKVASAVGFLFLGSLLYGASIMLIAQIYHIGEHYPDGIFWWAMGVLPLALLVKSSVLMMLAAALGSLWFFTQASLNYFPGMFPLFLFAMAWHVFKVKQSNILFLYLVAGTATFLEYSLSWIIGTPHRFSVEIDNLILGFSIFILFHGLSKWLSTRTEPFIKDYAALLSVWSLRFFLLSLFVFSFKDPWQEVLSAQWQMPALVGAITAVLCVSSILLSKKAANKVPVVNIILSVLLGSLFFISVGQTPPQTVVYLQIATNFILIITGITLIITGIRSSVSHFFFLGVITILLTGLCRYIDLVGDYIGAAILFIIFSIILLTTAKFWKHHHRKGKDHGR